MNSRIISKIGLGSVQFGLDYGISNKLGITRESEVRNILDYARIAGINLIDTAYSYGQSEKVLGSIGTKGFKIVTKFIDSAESLSVTEQVRISLKRLEVHSLYGLLSHRPLDIIKNRSLWDEFLLLKQRNVVQKIGFSFNSPDEAESILLHGFCPDLIQVPFNYLDNRFLPYIMELKSKGCEIHSRSTFLQGLFFMEPKYLEDFFDEIKPLLLDLQKNKSELPGLLLKYCLQKPFIDKVIVGVNNKAQLEQNINMIKTDNELNECNIIVKHEILTPSRWHKTK